MPQSCRQKRTLAFLTFVKCKRSLKGGRRAVQDRGRGDRQSGAAVQRSLLHKPTVEKGYTPITLGQHLLSPVPDIRRSWFAQVPVFTNRRHYYSSGHCKCSAVLSSPNAALALSNKNRIKRLDEAKGRLMAFYKKQGQKANKIAREHIRDKMESISSRYQSRLSVLERVLVNRITDM